jgi:hypothetical protein
MKKIVSFIVGSLCVASLAVAGPIYISLPTAYTTATGTTIATNTVTTAKPEFGSVWGIYIEGPTAWTGNVSVATERGITLLTTTAVSGTNGPYLVRWPAITSAGLTVGPATNFVPIAFQLYGEKIKVTGTGVVPSTNVVRVIVVQQ